MNIITYCAQAVPPVLLELWGPFKINTYGFFILLAVGISFGLGSRDRWRQQIISQEKLNELLVMGIFVGIAGGRALYALVEWEKFDSLLDVFAIWQGGFSVLGTLISVFAFLLFSLHRTNIQMIPLLDLVAFYAPLLQSLARLGCFFAGCCYGIPTDVSWAVEYFHPNSFAPLYEKLHPTQLYSVGLLFCIFLCMLITRHFFGYRPGRYLMLYLMLSGLERFFVDFWRADRVFHGFVIFSAYQWVALALIIFGFTGLLMLEFSGSRRVSEYI